MNLLFHVRVPVILVYKVDAIFSDSDIATLTNGRERLGAAFADKERTSHQIMDLNPPSTPTAQVSRFKDLEVASPLLNPRISREHWRLNDPSSTISNRWPDATR
jgi:hypothetical protein